MDIKIIFNDIRVASETERMKFTIFQTISKKTKFDIGVVFDSLRVKKKVIINKD